MPRTGACLCLRVAVCGTPSRVLRYGRGSECCTSQDAMLLWGPGCDACVRPCICQALALECELQRLSLQREREEGNRALRDLYEVGVAGAPSSEAEQLLQLETGKEELMAEVDRLKAANAVLTKHLHIKAEELLEKDRHHAVREQQVLQALARMQHLFVLLLASVHMRICVCVCAQVRVLGVRVHLIPPVNPR